MKAPEPPSAAGPSTAAGPSNTTGSRFAVDADTLAGTGARLSQLADHLAASMDGLRGPALAALGAIPPSDLFNAYAFCWGRWSRMLEDAEPALRSAAHVATGSARRYATVEARLAQPSSAR